MNPTLREARGLIDTFLNASSTGEPFRLLVISTLGVVSRDGGLDLAMHDTDLPDIKSSGLSLRELVEAPTRAPVMVLLDSFNVGDAALPRGSLARVTSAVARPLAVLGSASTISRTESEGSSLLHWVAAGLATGKADLGGRGMVDVQDLHDYVLAIAKMFGQSPYFTVIGSPQHFAFPVTARRAVPAAPVERARLHPGECPDAGPETRA